MSLYREMHFEIDICAQLSANGGMYANGDTADDNRARTQ
jgi:hypothetical protein